VSSLHLSALDSVVASPSMSVCGSVSVVTKWHMSLMVSPRVLG
jgi:hypothetical protein